MAKFQSKVKVNSAKVDASSFDLSGTTVNTSDFFKPIPIRTIPIVPGDKVTVKTQSFVRLHPLAVPTFGRVEMINRWFFVPYRSIFRGWNSFIERVPYKANVLQKVPTVRNDQLVSLFISGLTLGNVQAGDKGDFVEVVSVGDGSVQGSDIGLNIPDLPAPQNSLWLRLNARGRHALSILHSLGYSINMLVTDTTEMSILPLLAYFRVYLDYYSDPQEALFYEQYFDMIDSSIISQSFIQDLFLKMTATRYDFDYFTSAWKNPESPNDLATSLDPGMKIIDITQTSITPSSTAPQNAVSRDNQNQYSTQGYAIHAYSNSSTTTQTNLRSISHYMIDALKTISNLARRHNLVGWRIMDRYLADYGKKLDYTELNQSLFLNSKIVPVQISDVTSTTDTYSDGQGKVLGAYAGKGIGFDEFDLKFSIDKEFGMLICISSLIPKTAYYQGRCKQQGVLAYNWDQFYHGDMDGLGVQAIQLQELFADMVYSGEMYTNWHNTYNPQSIFGYSNRFAEYKNGYDTLAGDFRVNTLKVGSDSFHLFRTIYPSGTVYDIENPKYSDLSSISPKFRIGDQEQYDRIFTNASTVADHFMCFHNFVIKARRNMLSLGEELLHDEDYQNDDVTVNRDGTMFN